MHITPLPPLTLRDFAPAGPPRSEGTLHLTQITGHILQSLAPSRYGREMPAADRANYQEMGFLWEDILGPAFASRAMAADEQSVRFRPEEVERDGVVGSPDALVLESDTWVVEEYKATWKSARTVDLPTPGAGLTDEKFMGYLMQMKGYCHMIGALRSRLYILFINGEYGDRMVPEVRAYQFDWTRRDLEEQWAMFLNVARAQGWRD